MSTVRIVLKDRLLQEDPAKPPVIKSESFTIGQVTGVVVPETTAGWVKVKRSPTPEDRRILLRYPADLIERIEEAEDA